MPSVKPVADQKTEVAVTGWAGTVGGRAEAGARAGLVATPLATLQFQTGWSTAQFGELVQGARLSIDYDPARLPICRSYHGGFPAWDLYGYAVFHPSGQSSSGNLVRHVAPEPGGPGRILDPPQPVPLEMDVPLDATQVELWFHNTDYSSCSAWDSRYGQNYWFDVAPSGPRRPVSYRTGAIRSLEMVNVFADSATKVKHGLAPNPLGGFSGVDIQTLLSVRAWVNNVAYTKNVWIDFHVFDGSDELIHSETLTLHYDGPAGGGGDFFLLDQRVYQGSVATPGSVSPMPDARTLQYRLYYEVNSQVFSDGILHQHELPEDASLHDFS